jgi:hypothetical protein
LAGFIAVAVVLCIAMLLWLGGRNCRRLVVPARDVSRQLAGVASGLVVVLGLFGAIMVQLATLRYQADQFGQHRAQRAQAIRDIRTMMASGWLTPAIYQRFGAATNAIPEVFLERIIAREGRDAIYRIDRFLRPVPETVVLNHPELDRIRRNPILARRYGLIPRSAKDEAATQTNLPAASTNPPAFKLNPAMMKRYGLQP